MLNKPVSNPELEALLERARNHVMTPEEREAQRQSWGRAMQPCEHGEADFEQCQECWKAALALEAAGYTMADYLLTEEFADNSDIVALMRAHETGHI